MFGRQKQPFVGRYYDCPEGVIRNLGVWESFFNFAAQSRVMNNLEFLTECHREDIDRKSVV